MFIVPLPGDRVETLSRVSYIVLAYTNYRDVPSLYVQGAGVVTKNIPFADISKINAVPVKLTAGNVFIAANRSQQLPLLQKNDKVTVKTSTIKVDVLKINQRNNLASGMLVYGNDIETGANIAVRLADVKTIIRADGTETNIQAFRKQFSDYLGSSGTSV